MDIDVRCLSRTITSYNGIHCGCIDDDFASVEPTVPANIAFTPNASHEAQTAAANSASAFGFATKPWVHNQVFRE